MTFHGSGSAMLDGLERTHGEILPAAELERRGLMPATGEGSKFSGKGGPKEFVSVGHGESGLGTSMAYADAAKGLAHYNPQLIPYDKLEEEVKRLQYVVDHFDTIDVQLGGPYAQLIKKDKQQFQEQLQKLGKELEVRNQFPPGSARRMGGPGNAEGYPVLFEFDTSKMDVKIEHRAGVAPGGMLGGEASIHGGIDLKKRMRRAYAPAEHVSEVQAKLKAIFGHDDFEVIAIEALDGLPDPGMIGGSRKATYKALGEMEKQVSVAERAYELAAREGRRLDIPLYLELLLGKP
jgi:hypothetical protein